MMSPLYLIPAGHQATRQGQPCPMPGTHCPVPLPCWALGEFGEERMTEICASATSTARLLSSRLRGLFLLPQGQLLLEKQPCWSLLGAACSSSRECWDSCVTWYLLHLFSSYASRHIFDVCFQSTPNPINFFSLVPIP